jgi:hypothetical protein
MLTQMLLKKPIIDAFARAEPDLESADQAEDRPADEGGQQHRGADRS